MIRSTRAFATPSRRKAPMPGSSRFGCALPGRQDRSERLRTGHGHSGCVVRFRFDPCVHGGRSDRSRTGPGPIRPIFISKARTSIAAGSSRRCWKACGTRGRAPYKAVLTHGFVLDEQGRKMSKSLGNVVAPQTVADKDGAEILRLWAASLGFHRRFAHRPGHYQGQCRGLSPLAQHHPLHARQSGRLRRKRAHRACGKMPELERFMLARLAELDGEVRAGYGEFDFNRVYTTLFNFCTNDLSAFYFDIRKDALYCDTKSSHAPARRAHRDGRNVPSPDIWFAPHSLLHHGRSVGDAFSATKRACICKPRLQAQTAGRTTSCCRNGSASARSGAWSPARSNSRGETRSSAPASKPRLFFMSKATKTWRCSRMRRWPNLPSRRTRR